MLKLVRQLFAAMELKLLSTTFVKPETSIHRKIALTIFDKAAADLHVGLLIVFDTPTVSNTKLKDALAKVLTLYPILAGKLSQESPIVYLDDDSGVPVYETEVSGNLADFLPLEPNPALTILHPRTESSNPLFLVQMNRFDCGSLILGVCTSHKIADGQSMSNFFMAWSQMVRDEPVKVQPLLMDPSLLVPRNPPIPDYPHEKMEFTAPPFEEPVFFEGPIRNLLVHYSMDFVKKLKERAGSKYSTFVCMLAHIWRTAVIARGFGEDEVTTANVSVDGRMRLGIPRAYFGNMVLTAFPEAKVRDLVQGGLEHNAKLVREAVREMGIEYFQSFIDFGALNEDKELIATVSLDGNTLSPDIEVDSWLSFDFHRVDMGGSLPYISMPSYIPVEGIVIIMPAPCRDKEQQAERWGGGINVIICLSHDHAVAFEQIAHTLD